MNDIDWVAITSTIVSGATGAFYTYLRMRPDWKVGRSLRPPPVSPDRARIAYAVDLVLAKASLQSIGICATDVRWVCPFCAWPHSVFSHTLFIRPGTADEGKRACNSCGEWS